MQIPEESVCNSVLYREGVTQSEDEESGDTQAIPIGVIVIVGVAEIEVIMLG